jgi:hypothetical protein
MRCTTLIAHVYGQRNIKPIATFNARAKNTFYGPIYVPPTLLSKKCMGKEI